MAESNDPVFTNLSVSNDEFRIRIPIGRQGRAKEVADTIAVLTSDGAGCITGPNTRVDGGVTQ